MRSTKPFTGVKLMDDAYSSSLLYACVAVATMIAGAIIASIYPIKRRGEAAIQHFAAGVVFAAVALELIPRISGNAPKIDVALGFLVGVICMLLLKVFTNGLDKGGQDDDSKESISLGMILGITIDLLIDGVLIGLSFLAGMETGILIASALAIETLSLGLALSVAFKKSGAPFVKTFISVGTIALSIPCGAAFSLFVLDALPHTFDTLMLAFGTAALLYLVTEELLMEAHETPDTPLITSAFFLGFSAILILN